MGKMKPNKRVFKEGDELICVPSMIADGLESNGGGAGWEPQRIFIVKEIIHDEQDINGTIYWPKNGKNDCGIYHYAVKRYINKVEASFNKLKKEVSSG